jgi:ATP/maltotriose-dependent transcriptional regulator MalT
MVTLARTLWLRGSVDKALEVAGEALGIAQRLEHPISLCIAFIYTATVYIWTEQWDRAAALIEQLLIHAKRHMLGPYVAVAKGLQGELLVKRGEWAAGIELLYECLTGLRSGHHQVLSSMLLGALVQGLMEAERYDEAHNHMRDALVAGKATFDTPEILRIHGALLASMPNPDFAQAEAVLRHALTSSREQSALSWELRSATTLASLLRRQGRQVEARTLLAEVHARFTAGVHTVDYVRATRMLEELV